MMNEIKNNEIQECEGDKVSYVWIWAILFLLVLFIAMVEF